MKGDTAGSQARGRRSAAPSPKHTVSTYITLYGSLGVIGMIEGARAILLPEIRIDLGINYSMLGFLIFTSFLGFFIGAFVSGFLTDRFSDKLMLIASVLLIGVAGLLFLSVHVFSYLIVIYFVMRLGIGGADIVTSAHGSRIFKRHAAAQMNILHLFFGIGAAASPLAASALLLRGVRWQVIFFILSVPALFFTVQTLLTRYKPQPRARESSLLQQVVVILKNRQVWFFSLLLGIAIGAEGIFLDWIKNFLVVIAGVDEMGSSTTISIFYAALLVSRLVNGFFADRFGYMRVYIFHVVGAILALGLGTAIPGLIPAYGFYGWFVGPLFPLVITMASKSITEQKGGAIGIVIAVGGVVATTYSALLGVFHDAWGSHVGFSFILIGIILALLFVLALQVRTRMQAPTIKNT